MKLLRLLLAAVLFVGMAGLPFGCGGNGETPKKTPKTEDVKKAGDDVKKDAEKKAGDVMKETTEKK